MASGADVAKILEIVMPLVKAFTKAAEDSSATGPEKHAVVADQVKKSYEALQKSGKVKEVDGVPWELVAELVVPVTGGLISLLVEGFNKLGVFVKDAMK